MSFISERESLKIALTRLEKENTELKDELQRYEHETLTIQEIRQELQQTEDSLQYAWREVDKLRSENEALKIKVERVVNLRTQDIETIQKKCEQLDELHSELASVKKAYGELLEVYNENREAAELRAEVELVSAQILSERESFKQNLNWAYEQNDRLKRMVELLKELNQTDEDSPQYGIIETEIAELERGEK